jgi:hypothetical protein
MGVAVGFAARRWLTTRKLASWKKRAHVLATGDDIPDGTLVRVIGEIVEQATIATLFQGRPAVLFRSQVGDADETRGIDFEVQVDGQTRVKVDVRDALLLDELTEIDQPPVCGPVSALTVKKGPPRLHSDFWSPPPFLARFHRLRESLLAPGDTVEVLGFYERAPAPDPAFIFGTTDVPLQIRRVSSGGAVAGLNAPVTTGAAPGQQTPPPGIASDTR